MSLGVIKLEQIVLEAAVNGDIAPVLASAPAMQVALSIANQVQVAMIRGGPVVQSMGWKWNRIYPPSFATNSFQQDYATNNLNIGWLERCQGVDFNNTSVPKPVIDVLVKRDLVTTYRQWLGPVSICWLYNNQLMYGVWGGTALNNQEGLSNPGPNVVYKNPVGATTTPSNPITQIQDPNGNFWYVSTFGTCGGTQPTWTNPPVFPTLSSPSATPSTVTDGTTVWTALNPTAQGFRLSPIPPQTGRVWMMYPIAQAKPVAYVSLESFIAPIPDEFYTYFLEGFTALCYLKSVDPKVRAKYADSYKNWIVSLDNAVRAGNVEPDDFRFVPECPIMSPSADGIGAPRADFPLSGSGYPGYWY